MDAKTSTTAKATTKTPLAKTPHSAYWADLSRTEKLEGTERLLHLASLRRSVGNFVRILTGDPSIVVKFSSGQMSYTDGKTVIISAEDNPKKFDSMVGLALHEGSHCLLSNFHFLAAVHESITVFHKCLHPDLAAMYLPHESRKLKALRELIKTVMNVIEDRRIDSFIYRTASGYRPYYDEMYRVHFLNNDVLKSMKHDPEMRTPTTENYINWLIMMVAEGFDRDALPGLGAMVDTIDVANIRRFDADAMAGAMLDDLYIPSDDRYDYNALSLLWRVSNEIALSIIKYAKLHESEDKGGHDPLLTGLIIDLSDMDPNALPNYDIPQGTFNKERAGRALIRIRDAVNGEIGKKKITQSEETQLTTLESSNSTLAERDDSVLGKVRCMVTRSLTMQILESSWFPFTDKGWGNGITRYDVTEQAVIDGIRMGQALAHRLQIRNDPTTTHFTRQESGRIDRRLLHSLGMDITSVFKRTTVEHFRPVMLHLSIDASGSMSGDDKWGRAFGVASALVYAADRIRNFDVVLTVRGTISSGMPIVSVVHDSRKHRFHHLRTLAPFLRPSGSTPEGLCFMATQGLIEECKETHRVFFVNFSDGEPGCQYNYQGTDMQYFGDVAIDHTRRMVRTIRESDISVLSYFICHTGRPRAESEDAFRRMYGDTAVFIDPSQITQVLRTMNALLLER